MTFKVVIEWEARQEWNSGVDFYEVKEPGLGIRFNSVVRACLQTLVDKPERFPFVGHLTRKAKILGWPYSVYFTINEKAGEVVVVGIWHGRRNPAGLRRRVK